ncbi:UNVERIFIED_CONTAM: hypothetical protein LK11_04850 [Mumia flava]
MPDLPASSYYVRLDQDEFASTDATQSPWDFSHQHGGPPAALLARCIAERTGSDPLAIGKIDVDFLGPIPQGRCRIEVEELRGGRRVRQVAARLLAEGRTAVAARAWLISTEDGRAAESGRPFAPPPLPEAHVQFYFPRLDPSWGYGRSIEWRYVDRPMADDAPLDTGDVTTRLWGRVRVPLVHDEPTADLERMLVLADSTNGISGTLPMDAWLFVPPGLGVVAQRAPRGPWIYLEARSHTWTRGTGVAHATIADADGLCGYATQALLVAPR